MILNRVAGRAGHTADPGDLSLLTYLLESGSDRAGALDFQSSSEHYQPRGGAPATLEELVDSAARVEAGVPLSPELDKALLHGTSIGGARPKAVLRDGQRHLIAKFASTTDTYPVVKGEFVALELARRAGISVARTELTRAHGRDVLLSERFDRIAGTERRDGPVSQPRERP